MADPRPNYAALEADQFRRKATRMGSAALLASTERRYADAADFLNRQVTHLYALNTGAGVR